jgi:hypothetical protein
MDFQKKKKGKGKKEQKIDQKSDRKPEPEKRDAIGSKFGKFWSIS